MIAETNDLGTRFAKMVVTDDQGRYVLPDLPKAKYKVWVRGYGLVDSAKVDGEPGKRFNLTAVPAPDDAAAAQYYPAIYWYAMLKIPAADQFNGKSDIPDKLTQADWLTTIKNQACVGCHQLGQLATRTIPSQLGHFDSGEEAWARRIQSGQAAPLMVNPMAGKFASVPLKYFGDWTDRVAKGELPFAKPPRPQGVERNVVVTTWDWGNDKQYLHDLISSDKRNPTVNANGLLYGSPEYATDHLPVLDPKTAKVTYITPPEGADVPEALGPGHAAIEKPLAASAYWGMEKVWDTKFDNHNDMFDSQGRLWLTGTNHAPGTPAFCRKGSDNPYAKAFPIDSNERQLAMFDPKSQKFTFIDTCFGTHHLQFGFDKDNTLWTCGGGALVGWLDTKVFDETGSAEKAQGWAPFVLDTNGNGQLDDYTEPGQPADPNKDTRIAGSGSYAVMPNPARRLDLVHDQRVRRQRRRRALRSQDQAHRSLLHPDARLWPARRRHRRQGRRLGVAGQRPSRQLRPLQVQGPAQRTEGDRRSLPGGLDVLQISGPGLPRYRRQQRRGELLHLGRSAQRGRARQQRADLDGERERRLRRAGQRQDGVAAHPVSARLLCQGT